MAALHYMRAARQKLLAVVNVPESTIARESEIVFRTYAGPEIGVASTKAFTCQLTALACLAILAGKLRGTITAEQERELVGALVMAVILSRFPVTRSAGYVILGGAAVYGMASVFFGVSENAVLSILFLFFFGAGDTISQVNRKTLMQVMTPPEVLGRVSAVNSLSTMMGNQLGQFESGMTAAWFGAVGSAVFGGVAVLAMVGIWAWRYPELRRIERADTVGVVPVSM